MASTIFCDLAPCLLTRTHWDPSASFPIECSQSLVCRLAVYWQRCTVPVVWLTSILALDSGRPTSDWPPGDCRYVSCLASSKACTRPTSHQSFKFGISSSDSSSAASSTATGCAAATCNDVVTSYMHVQLPMPRYKQQQLLSMAGFI